MPLSEWRQRLRIVAAMKRLESGIKVESITLDLGYGSASSFIAMFKKLMGVTPDEYRGDRQISASPLTGSVSTVPRATVRGRYLGNRLDAKSV